MDVFFSADVETDGPIPGPYSALSFALVYAGSFDGEQFVRPKSYETYFYRELRPISEMYQEEALAVNGLNRDQLLAIGDDPKSAMSEAYDWVNEISGPNNPVLVAYPVSFDWTWLYWYFTCFSPKGSPFGHSQCFDIKTAYSVKNKTLMRNSSRSKLPKALLPSRPHTHNALDDAIEQAEIFANVFELDASCQNLKKEKNTP
ncbi:MAG: 3'-5' exoribonuclease domain-containing protein [Rhodospirillales bacterium]